jgi:3-dehydroquinate synthase
MTNPAMHHSARTHPAMPETVHVALGARAYDIIIGRDAMAGIGTRLAAMAPGATAAIVTDTHVGALHAAALEASLKAAGLRSCRITVAPGEATKSWGPLATVVDALLAEKIERGDLVIALGGGVVGDLTGFASAVLRRGVRFVQVPTSLLAQVDSSVGGKTGINSSHGKNLIGAFHQPSLVIADTALLDTLSVREFAAGYAEVVKYGLIDDSGFFDWCEANWAAIRAGGPEREHAVAVSCRAKAAIVIRDEREEGDRALLNLGHTFAHALERITGYDSTRLVHGEAVAIGLALAFRFSQELGLCPGQDATRVTRHLQAAGLPTRLQDVPGGCGTTADIVAAMGQDKKVKRGVLTFILARGIGQSFVAPGIAASDVTSFIERELSA